MSPSIDISNQLEQWLAEEVTLDVLLTPLPHPIAHQVVDRLKAEVDRNWSRDLQRSFALASRIVAIGQARQDRQQEALGLMAQGDTLKYMDRYEEAWNKLNQAGEMFRSVNDQVGWARTRIGRLVSGVKLNRASEALADVEYARTIFSEHGETEKLLRLEINTAYIHAQLGNQHQVLSLNHTALSIAEGLGDAGHSYLGLVHMNIGFAHEALGNFPEALHHYQQASALFRAGNETRHIANIELNIAYIAHAQGHYRQALQMIYSILEKGVDQFPMEARAIRRDLVEFYLYLNRYAEARDLAQQIVADYRSIQASYDVARALLHFAVAEAELRNFTSALTALNEAESIFTEVNATTWAMLARLRRGQVALKQGYPDVAYADGRAASSYFKEQGQQINYATASLLMGQAAFAIRDLASATLEGNRVVQIAQRHNLPTIRYSAHVLLGKIADAQSKRLRAIQHYWAATYTIDRVQRGLTITLRSGFLEDKGQAWRELIALYLQTGEDRCAFEALERSKSQVLMGYMANREQFLWARNDPQNGALIAELDRLRIEQQAFYRRILNLPKDQEFSKPAKPDSIFAEVRIRERRIRAITEHLYLNSSIQNEKLAESVISLPDMQRILGHNTVLIEFYNDGRQIWAFTLNGQTCQVQHLPINVEELNRLLNQLQGNLNSALQFDVHSPSARPLIRLGQRILQHLYSQLLAPLQLEHYGTERLIIVPYGALHYLPFNLLHDGSKYLIERYEVVTLPASSLLMRSHPERMGSALVLSYSWEGRLPQTRSEAQLIHELFGGTLYAEESAVSTVLQMPPTQILHIAAHGEHRLDQPDLSYIELADGQIYADDLLQQDLSYELVTLSGCETGRAKVAADEELIGIGRGLLYAGAGALILSLWQVTDSSTMILMERLYRALRAGKSKAASLREAQTSIMAENPELHPAFWGAFQLIGDAQPLSQMI